jgi:hypothetical protein
MGIKVLYWNIDNGEARLRTVLEASPGWDLIAIQEPPISQHTKAPRHTRGSRYKMVYHSGRAALYVNKRLARDQWRAEAGPDWACVSIGQGEVEITIFTVYSEGHKTQN